MNRQDVYKLIDGEREYQNELNPRFLTIGEELLLLGEYIDRARNQWTEEFVYPEVKTLDVLRKVAGIATRVLEHQDIVPPRLFFDDRDTEEGIRAAVAVRKSMG